MVSLRGWPDLTLWRPPIKEGWAPGNLWMAELKTERGRLSAEQKACIASLRLTGVEVHVLKPRHVPWIIRRLKRGCYDPGDPPN